MGFCTFRSGVSIARSSSLVLLFFGLIFSIGACTKKAPIDLTTLSPEQLQERGRLIYAQNCLACHSKDASLEGSLGPALRGASRELLHAKLVLGTYPKGYTPKRSTSIMPPMPQLEREILALEAYLR